MADKSPRKQSAVTKLTTKEKQDRKKVKKAAKTQPSMPAPAKGKKG